MSTSWQGQDMGKKKRSYLNGPPITNQPKVLNRRSSKVDTSRLSHVDTSPFPEVDTSRSLEANTSRSQAIDVAHR